MAKIEKGLLIHWWHYYGKLIYTLDELQKFEKIIDEYGVDRVLDVGVASAISKDGSPTIILLCIRQNKVKELFDSLPDVSKMNEKEKTAYEKLREEFVSAISKTAG